MPTAFGGMAHWLEKHFKRSPMHQAWTVGDGSSSTAKLKNAKGTWMTLFGPACMGPGIVAAPTHPGIDPLPKQPLYSSAFVGGIPDAETDAPTAHLRLPP
jgi:hypothetical protein